MEKSFDFGRLLKNHEKKHKNKPKQFVSVADGVKKRLDTILKLRKSSRLTEFDSIRNLSGGSSPASMSDAQQKLEHRRQQLQKWKEEKEKKRKEAASQKKKPFVAGVPHASLRYIPPPPPPAKPSTSGRVTRSQSSRNTMTSTKPVSQALTQSFAPKNASFKPPQLRNMPKVPYVNLVALKPKRIDKKTLTFNPVLPKTQTQTVNDNVRQTRSRAQNKQKTVELKSRSGDMIRNTNCKITKPSLKINSNTVESTFGSKMDARNSRKAAPKVQHQSTNTDTDSSSQSSDCKSSPHSKSRSQKSIHSGSPILVSRTPRKSLTPKNPVPKSESSSEEKLRSPKSPLEMPMTPEQITEEAKRISPCVTMSRGKDNARREMKKKMEEGLLDEDTSECDNLDHFRRQLASEITRITDMCETWDRISEQTVLPDTIQELVLGAVGQARLLMSQKLQQFGSLVERCARPERGSALVTPADLRGFWDMVFMQVENVDMRFKKLEYLRSRGWQEEQPLVVVKKKTQAKAKPKPTAPSRIKDMIAAARKAQKEQAQAHEQPAPPADAAERTFEAGFFCVRSPARSPARPAPLPPPAPCLSPARSPARPRSAALLKAVLSNEAKKSATRNSASFAMLRASVLGKDVECDGVAPLPPTPLPHVNYNATPGRSILKQSTDSKTPLKKSIKVVLFDQSDCESDKSVAADQDQKSEGAENTQKVLDPEVVADGGLSSMDIEKEEKENSTRKSHRLMRQDATDDGNPVMTRSRRKSGTPQVATRRSTRRSRVLEEPDTNTMAPPPELSLATPKRGARRRQNLALQQLTA